MHAWMLYHCGRGCVCAYIQPGTAKSIAKSEPRVDGSDDRGLLTRGRVRTQSPERRSWRAGLPAEGVKHAQDEDKNMEETFEKDKKYTKLLGPGSKGAKPAWALLCSSHEK